jgi:glycerol-3-phosphate dehydrogenase subunit C
MRLASRTFDLGEYLKMLLESGDLDTGFGRLSAKTAYYPPCHLREQRIGAPYTDLLALVPGLDVSAIEGGFHCCGIAGIMGFKKDFHEVSVDMGRPLVEKIDAIAPEWLVTDCLSCRIQFQQLTSYRIFHPVEILADSYENGQVSGLADRKSES